MKSWFNKFGWGGGKNEQSQESSSSDEEEAEGQETPPPEVDEKHDETIASASKEAPVVLLETDEKKTSDEVEKQDEAIDSCDEKKEKVGWNSLDDLILAHILEYISIVPKVQVVAMVNKILNTLVKAALHQGSKGNAGTLDKANDDQEGRAFSYVLDHLRFEVLQAGLGNVSSEARRIAKEPGDLYLLRHGGLMNDLMSLNAAIYSYWDTTPSRPDEGVIYWMEKAVEASSTDSSLPPLSRYINTSFYRDVRHFKDDRVYGSFILLFDTPSGSILVEMKSKKVYKVLGIRDSIGTLVGARKPFEMFSALIGAELIMTILPWNGDIVYDGLMACKKSKVSRDELRQALRMYINAVDSGNLIITLPRLASSAPSSSSSSRHQTSRKKAAYSGPSPESLKITLSLELGCIKSLPTDNKELMWVFRRHGYSERENPDHLVTVLSSQMSRGAIVEIYQFKALDPTVEEIVRLLLVACREVGGSKPQGVACDCLAVIEPLKVVLESAGVGAHYYPPPSEEEQRHLTDGRFMTNSTPMNCLDRFPPGAKVCYLCTRETTPDDTPLLQCSRCKSAYYCSKEHQKIHWKVHKKVCK